MWVFRKLADPPARAKAHYRCLRCISFSRIVVKFQSPSDSERRVLKEVLRDRESTHAKIMRSTRMSQQTVSRLVNELSSRGTLVPGRKISDGQRGQPRATVELNSDYALSLGVSLMTDAMSVLLMNFAGDVVDYRQTMMPSMSRKAVFTELHRITDAFFADRSLDRERLTGVGVGISGYNLNGSTRFNPPRQLDEWAMVELDHLFTQELDLPAWVENDGNAAAVGEAFLGAGRKLDNFVYVFIAAGIGGGVISNHRLLRGVHGNGGEVGLILPRDMHQMPTLATLQQAIGRAGVHVDGISDMIERFDPKWPGIDEWLERSRDPLSQIASSIAALLDPDAIVIGGRVPQALAARLIPAIELYDDSRRAEPRPLPRIVLSETKVDACAIGAAMLPLENRFFSAML